MMNRRDVLSAFAGLGATAFALDPASAQARLSDDGLYTQPWFVESFLHLGEDLEAAAAAGKHFAIMWELRGCPYCKDTHVINFADPAISRFVQERFDILQLNVLGAREVTDFDGAKLSEKALAEKYGVRFTPTFQFFPPSTAGLAGKKPREREVTRAHGYLPPPRFLAMFRFVAEKAYEKGSLAAYLQDKS